MKKRTFSQKRKFFVRISQTFFVKFRIFLRKWIKRNNAKSMPNFAKNCFCEISQKIILRDKKKPAKTIGIVVLNLNFKIWILCVLSKLSSFLHLSWISWSSKNTVINYYLSILSLAYYLSIYPYIHISKRPDTFIRNNQ